MSLNFFFKYYCPNVFLYSSYCEFYLNCCILWLAAFSDRSAAPFSLCSVSFGKRIGQRVNDCVILEPAEMIVVSESGSGVIVAPVDTQSSVFHAR